MASSRSRIPKDDSARATETGAPSDTEVEAANPVDARVTEDRSARRLPTSRAVSPAERDRLVTEARNVEFPTGLRGYDRDAVDRYVQRVNRLIAELEMSASPEAAVRHALDEVSEETRDILQGAHRTADEITARSRAKADDRLQQAEREAQETVDAAQLEAKETREAAEQAATQTREAAEQSATQTREAAQQEAHELREMTAREAQNLRETAQNEAADLRGTTTREMTEFRETSVREAQQLRAAAKRDADEMVTSAHREADEILEHAESRNRELARNAEAMWRERRRLIDDMRAVGEQLIAIGDVEAKRFQRLAEEVSSGDEQTDVPSDDAAAEPTAPQEPAQT